VDAGCEVGGIPGGPVIGKVGGPREIRNRGIMAYKGGMKFGIRPNLELMTQYA